MGASTNKIRKVEVFRDGEWRQVPLLKDVLIGERFRMAEPDDNTAVRDADGNTEFIATSYREIDGVFAMNYEVLEPEIATARESL